MGQGPHSSGLISSTQNTHVKWLRALGERRGREATGAFCIEGPRALEQALLAGGRPLVVAHSPELGGGNEKVLSALAMLPEDFKPLLLGRRAFGTISDTVTSQGLLAAFPIPAPDLSPLDPRGEPALVLDRVSDPGNVGTLIRSAAAAGSQAVLLAPGCADPYSPKVVRSSAGSILEVRIATLQWSEIARLLRAFPHVFAAESTARRTYYEAELARGCAILIGNEAVGLGPEAVELATSRVSIPIERGVESLNAGVAGSILLFEARRQRLQEKHRGGDGPGSDDR